MSRWVAFSTVAVAVVLAGCVRSSVKRTFRIPYGYTGPVVIVYEQEKGETLLLEGERYVYHLSWDGFLIVQNPRIPPGGIHSEFYYVDRGGNRTPIPERTEGISVWNHSIGAKAKPGELQISTSSSGIPFETFYVGSPPDHSGKRTLEMGAKLKEAIAEIGG